MQVRVQYSHSKQLFLSFYLGGKTKKILCNLASMQPLLAIVTLGVKFYFNYYLRFGQWLRIYLSDPLVTCAMVSILRDTSVVKHGATAFKYGKASCTSLTSRCFRFCNQPCYFVVLYCPFFWWELNAKYDNMRDVEMKPADGTASEYRINQLLFT
jgi:hypothetical protein